VAVEKGYNNRMFGKFPTTRRFLVFGLLMMALSAAGVAHGQDTAKRGRKYKAPPPTARVEVTVVRATNGKPIENASVIFHPLEGGRDSGNMELKTNDEGKAVIDLLTIGSDVRLQIIAPGFQTYGQDYKVEKDSLAIQVKMKRPAEQYSIYKKGEDKPGDKSAGQPADKPEAAPKDGASSDPKPDAPKDAPKDEAKPQDSAPKL
jgi:hypothetical protein